MGHLLSLLRYNRSVPAELKQLHKQYKDTYLITKHYNVLNINPSATSTDTHSTCSTVRTATSSDDAVLPGIRANSATIAQQVNKQILAIQSNYIDEATGKVQYINISKSSEFTEYINTTRAELIKINLYELTELQCKVLLLNIYNALVIHGNIVLGTPTITQLQSFYSTTAYEFMDSTILSLDDIEHGVLRNNRIHPITKKSRFKSNDPRIKLCVPVDARIHFALNCGANSCPPIRVYRDDNIDRALNLATRAFIKQDSNLHVDMKSNTITLSKLFDWYSVDFGSTNDEVLQFIVRQLDGNIQADQIEQLIASNKYKIKYSTYDWDLNINH